MSTIINRRSSQSVTAKSQRQTAPSKPKRTTSAPSKKSNNNNNTRSSPVFRVDKLDPPVETPGEWVPREVFPHKKSFGVFHCSKCNKRWYSAHAFKEYWQRCKSCDREFLPVYMWLNLSVALVPKTDRLNGEHDVDRCGACAAGECISFLR